MFLKMLSSIQVLLKVTWNTRQISKCSKVPNKGSPSLLVNRFFSPPPSATFLNLLRFLILVNSKFKKFPYLHKSRIPSKFTDPSPPAVYRIYRTLPPTYNPSKKLKGFLNEDKKTKMK